MGDVIRMRDRYEVLRTRTLRKFKDCDYPGYKIKLANELSHLAERWSGVVRHSGVSLFRWDEKDSRAQTSSRRVPAGWKWGSRS